MPSCRHPKAHVRDIKMTIGKGIRGSRLKWCRRCGAIKVPIGAPWRSPDWNAASTEVLTPFWQAVHQG